MTFKEEQLIADYLAGKDVAGELLALLHDKPDLREELARQQVINRQLKAAVAGRSAEGFTNGVLDLLEDNNDPDYSESDYQKAVSKAGHHSWGGWLASAACMGLIFVSFWFLSPQLTSNDRVLGSVSNITGLVESSVKAGQAINHGSFVMGQGFVEVTLTNDVVLLLEGPARVEFYSADHIALTQGKLVARVPENATGFSVDTPSSEIIDLGTEFGVSVADSGESQVHVIDGEIKVRAGKDDHYEHLIQNQARAFDLQQQVAQIESQPERFMRALPGLKEGTPDYLHWSFDVEEPDAFPCNGPGIQGVCYPANKKSLSGRAGPNMIAGPFGHAVFFDGKQAWLETSFPGVGENKPRTVAFWVKVPSDFSVEEGFGILSWGLSDVLSAWQISPNPLSQSGPLGRIRVGTNMGEIVGTTDLRDDQWHHIAIVLFGGEEADLSTHILMYVDGRLERSTNKSIARVNTQLNHPQSKPLMMGRNLAFSGEVKASYPRRFFRGGLDEVFIFNRALARHQILHLMQYNEASD